MAERDVNRWMSLNREDYIDQCGELDCTKLAEEAADMFNLYENDDEATIPEWVFEMAAELA
jgi:hypothetical protein